VDQFKPKDMVDVIGISKGRVRRVVKRTIFAAAKVSHGLLFHAHGFDRASSYPSRVVPGWRMGGHMGHDRVNRAKLEIIDVDTQDNVLV